MGITSFPGFFVRKFLFFALVGGPIIKHEKVHHCGSATDDHGDTGDIVRSQVNSTNSPDQRDEWLLRIAASASAVFGFLQIWITMDIDKTPGELVKLLKSVVRGNVI